MTQRILAIGDLHLGRRPSRLPEDLDSGQRLGPSASWHASVEAAIDGQADAVLLAGDVVEDRDDLYEAYPDLAAGVERLAKHGITVLGIAGNHDGEVLPRLADSLPDFHLLGRGGRWEVRTIGGVEIVGWSFPGALCTANPLEAGLPPRSGNRPRLGLLHCDRDQLGSRYAPVRSAELQAADTDAWLLGHIHRPDPLSGERPAGYLGSAVGLDPGDAGARGPWWIRVQGPGAVSAEHVPLAPLRWESITVDLDDLTEIDAVHGRVLENLRALHERRARTGCRAVAVGCRLVFTGRPARDLHLEARLGPAGIHSLREQIDGTIYFIEALRIQTDPAIDLEQLAAGTDPVGLVAQRLLLLRRPEGDPERAALLRRARPKLESTLEQRTYWDLGSRELSDTEVAATLERAARQALDHLLSQRPETTDP